MKSCWSVSVVYMAHCVQLINEVYTVRLLVVLLINHIMIGVLYTNPTMITIKQNSRCKSQISIILQT